MAKKKTTKKPAKAGKDKAKAGPDIDTGLIKTQKEAAKYAGVNERTVRRWAREENMPVTAEGHYIKRFLDMWKENKGKELTPERSKQEQLTTRFKELRNKKLEMELQITFERRIDEILSIWSRAITEAKRRFSTTSARVIIQLPAKMRRKVKILIDRDIKQTLRELSENPLCDVRNTKK